MKTSMKCAAVLFSAVLIAGCLAACGYNTDIEETETEAITEAESETETAEETDLYDGIVRNLEVSANEDGSLVLTWDETPDAVGYLVEIHDAEGELIDSFTVREPETEITVPENGSYRVFVMRVMDIDGEEMTDIDSFAEIEFTVEADETTGAAAVTTTGATTAAAGNTPSGAASQTVAPSAATDPTEATVFGRDLATMGSTASNGNGNVSTPASASNTSGNTNTGSGRTNTNGSGVAMGGNTSGGSTAPSNTGSSIPITPSNTGNAPSGGNNGSSSGSGNNGNTGSHGTSGGNTGNTGNTGSGNAGTGGSGGANGGGGNATTPTQHQHTWVETQEVLEPARDETVCVVDAWDEPVYETHNICNECGVDLHGIRASEHSSEHVLNGGYGGWHTERIQVGTIHHDAEYQTIHHDAVINTYFVCSECGARG